MTTTTAATSWRNLADQLTPKQIADLEHWEVTSRHPNRDEAILQAAQEYAQGNAWACQYAGVPTPADATSVHEWTADFGIEVPFRHFWGTDRDGVFICGYQKPDGSVRRYICLDFRVEDIDSAGARDLAARLIAAADELDEVNAALA